MKKLIYISSIFFLFSFDVFSQTTIKIDGFFDEWNANLNTYVDDSSDSQGIELLDFSVSNDNEYLYIKIRCGSEIDLTEQFFNPAEVIINIDSDNNASTGYSINNIGSEYGINFFDKFIFDDSNPNLVDTLSLYDLDVIPLPTYSSDDSNLEPTVDCCAWCATVDPNVPSIPPVGCEDWNCDNCDGILPGDFGTLDSNLFTLDSNIPQPILGCMDVLATNYRITNIQSSILYSQLEVLDEIIEKKKNLYYLYTELLSPYLDKLSLQHIEESTNHSYWLYGIKLKKDIEYDIIEKYFKDNNIEIRPFFNDYRNHNHLKNIKSIDTIKNNNIILLPLHPNLSKNDIHIIVSCVKTF